MGSIYTDFDNQIKFIYSRWFDDDNCDIMVQWTTVTYTNHPYTIEFQVILEKIILSIHHLSSPL